MTDASHATPGAAPEPEPETDAPTLEAFLDGVGPRAFRFAELSLRQREDALDAVQDAMVRLLRYRDRPAGEWSPLFWRILRSRIVDAQRRSGFRLRWLAPAGQLQAEPDWADYGPDPARRHDGQEAWSRLSAALARLPRRQREAFTLRVLEELDVACTASAMGCSEGSVKTHLSRARHALQRELEDWK